MGCSIIHSFKALYPALQSNPKYIHPIGYYQVDSHAGNLFLLQSQPRSNILLQPLDSNTQKLPLILRNLTK